MIDPRLLPLLPGFRAEVAEHVDYLQQLFETCDSLAPERWQADLKDALRRAHGVKGGALSLGYSGLGQAAHVLEDALAHFQRSAERPDSEWRQAMYDVAAVMRAMSEHDPGGDAKVGHDKVAALAARVAPFGPITEAVEVAPRAAAIRPALEPAREATGPGADPPNRAAVDVVRVPGAKLDRLMASVGELMTASARCGALAHAWSQDVEQLAEFLPKVSPSVRRELSAVLSRLEHQARRARNEQRGLQQVVENFTGSIKSARMIALESEVPLWRRTVREAAQLVEKEVVLHVDVAEIELDKLAIDQLSQPLLHLLRNCVDHGLEVPEDRFEVGKPRVGVIEIVARLRGTQVELCIRDDGRGLDRALIEQKAVVRGVVRAEDAAAMDDDAIFSLLFAAGFSTRDAAGPLSGRGVGLDAVAHAARQLGGSARITSQGPDSGTTVTLLIPTNIASIRGLLVRAEDGTFVLPLDAVERVTRIGVADVKALGGRPVVQIAGDAAVRLCALPGAAGPDAPSRKGRFPIVAMRRGEERLALAVDEVLRDADLVVRPLPWNVRGTPSALGGVILDDGTVAILMDVAHLFETGIQASFQSSTEAAAPAWTAAGETRTSGAAAPRRLLVVDDSLTARALAKDALERVGYSVELASDGSEAWERLQVEEFAAVVSDIDMPNLDGIALTRRIRGSARLAHLPVLLVTTRNAQAMIDEGARAGADEYVIKGEYAMNALLAVLARQLGKAS
jgi:two-component system, chemotaxis family, sensor kinase CheA